MMRLLIVALAVLVVAALLAGMARGDEPGTPRFPYAELAALSALEAPVRVAAREAAVVRLRPGHEWPAVAEVEAGRRLTATAITPDRDPWLRVSAATLQGERNGWIRLASVGAPETALARLPIESAPPTMVEAAVWPLPVYARAGGPPTDLSLKVQFSSWDGSHLLRVVGRSADGHWLALHARDFVPPVVWVSAHDVELFESDLRVADLPIVVGLSTTVLARDESPGPAVQLTETATNWEWTSEGLIVGEHRDRVWSFDPRSGRIDHIARPPGRAIFAPTHRHIAIFSEERAVKLHSGCGQPNEYGSELHCTARDVTLLPLNGGEAVAFSDASVLTWRPRQIDVSPPCCSDLDLGRWSPDGRFLLVRSFNEVAGGGDLAYAALSVDGSRHPISCGWLPEGARCVQPTWSDTSERTVVFRDPRDGAEYAFTLNGEALPSAPSADREMHDRAAALQERVGDASVYWSPNGAHAVVVEQPGNDVLLFRAADESLEEISLPLSGAWGRFRGEWHVNARWSPRSDAFLATIRTGLFLSTLGAVFAVQLNPVLVQEAPLDGLDTSVCNGALEWSPDGRWFQIEVHEFGRWWDVDSMEREGVVKGVRQIRVYDRLGELSRVFRMVVGQPAWGFPSRHRATWSPDGEWLAIGRQDRHELCYVGA